MAWENRISGRYYYRVFRRGGKVKRQYLGKGPAAVLAARKDALDRAERQAKWGVEKAERQRFDDAVLILNKFTNSLTPLIKGLMLVAGYYQQRRGPWRKRRRRINMDRTVREDSKWPTQEEFNAIAKQANDGDSDALARLRQLLDAHPQIWAKIADLSGYAETAMLQLLNEGGVLAVEAVQRKLSEMRDELLGDSSTLLERLAVDRIVCAWLYVEVARIKAVDEGSTSKQGTAWSKRLDQGQREFDRALKSLADVRRFAGKGLLLTVRRAS